MSEDVKMHILDKGVVELGEAAKSADAYVAMRRSVRRQFQVEVDHDQYSPVEVGHRAIVQSAVPKVKVMRHGRMLCRVRACLVSFQEIYLFREIRHRLRVFTVKSQGTSSRSVWDVALTIRLMCCV